MEIVVVGRHTEVPERFRRHVEDIIYSLFAWDSGEYRIVPGDGASSERIRTELGWRPRLEEIDTIVRTAWAWR